MDDLTGPGRNSWERERYHRARIADGLTEARPSDWVIVGDCDEIAAPQVVADLRLRGTHVSSVKFELAMYYYNFNHPVQQGWAIGASRWWEERDPNLIRTCAYGPAVTYEDAGWHFSWFNGTQAILDKQAAFMHAHDPIIRDMPRDPAWIAAKVEAGQDLFNRPNFVIDHAPLSPRLPQYVLDHVEIYRAMGWAE